MQVRDVAISADTSFDLLIAAVDNDRRSSYVARLGIPGEVRLALALPRLASGPYDENMQLFLSSGWNVQSFDEVMRAIEFHCTDTPAIRVGIDISALPRKAMALLVETLFSLESKPTVTFIYSPASFDTISASAERPQPLFAGAVSSFFKGVIRPPSVPIGLILGLGLEPHRAIGVVELLEPTKTWSFVGRSEDRRFDVALQGLHGEFNLSVGSEGLIGYDMRSIATVYRDLESLVFGAALRYRLILAPSGPKMFSLVSMLIAAPRIVSRPAVWRIGPKVPLVPFPVEEAGDLVAATVVF